MSDKISRRDFIRTSAAAAGSIAVSGLFEGCSSRNAELKAAEGEMTYRTNSGNGDKVSLLGYGCMRWPMTKKEDLQVIDQEQVNKLVDFAISHGVNYFDAAPVYLSGNCERSTAQALAKYPRESYFIATKLSNFNNSSREAALKMYHESLENFNTNYIDYYLLHAIGGGGMAKFNERFVDNGVIDYLLEEKKAGHIRNLGFSFHGSRDCFDSMMALHEKYHWDFVQIQLNYMDWKGNGAGSLPAEYQLAELEKRHIPAIIMEPLLGGALASLPEFAVDMLKSRDPQSSVASWAFRFAGSPEGVLTVLSGMTYMEHLKDNLKAFSPLAPLTEEEMVYLEDVAEKMKKFPLVKCTHCDYCMPCPYGIDIPEIFKHYNKCVNEGCVNEDTGSPDYRKARRKYLISYDRNVPKLRQADRCISCGQCLQKCPQRINIPRELGKIWHYVEKLRRQW